MKKFLFLMLAIISLIAGEIKTVIVTGYGINKDKAIKNATKNALQQVVGMYVVSDEIVKNDKLIKDEVLSSSNGFVKSFKVLKVSQDDGMYQVDAKVEVELGKVIKRLEDLNIATKRVDSDEFKAVSLSKITNTKEFKKLAKKVIFDPIIENKKIHDIKIISLKPLEEDNILFKHNERYIQKNLEEEDRYPFELTFSIGLNPNYFESVKQFVKKTSKGKSNKKWKKNEFYFIKYVKGDGSSLRERIVTGYKFSPFRYAMLKKLGRDNYDKLKGRWKYTLLDKDGEVLSSNIYEIGYMYENHDLKVGYAFTYKGDYFSDAYQLGKILPRSPIIALSDYFEFYYKTKYTIHQLVFIKSDLVDKISSIKIERIKADD